MVTEIFPSPPRYSTYKMLRSFNICLNDFCACRLSVRERQHLRYSRHVPTNPAAVSRTSLIPPTPAIRCWFNGYALTSLVKCGILSVMYCNFLRFSVPRMPPQKTKKCSHPPQLEKMSGQNRILAVVYLQFYIQYY